MCGLPHFKTEASPPGAARSRTDALLHMVKVFCTLEERDMRAAVDGTLSDAAEGLAILMGDLVHRVETIHDNVTKLEDLWARESAVRR
jgi:hypothetical protein